MLSLFVLLLFQFPSRWGQPAPTIIEFNVPYTNFTTSGKLVPNSYEVAPNNDTRPFAIRVFLRSRDESLDKPVSLVLMRGISYLSTFIPRIQTYDGDSEGYYFLSETLCEESYLVGKPLAEFNETVRLTVSSSVPAAYDLTVTQLHGFVIEMKPRTILFSPSEPVFYRFSFPEFVDAIAIRVSTMDNVCGRVTIQRAACPVFDTEGQVVLYDTYNQQTFTQKAFIVVKREEFGGDINIILSVLPVDSPCRTINGYQFLHDFTDNQFRIKNVTAEIQPFRPSTIPLIFIIIIYIVVFVVVYCVGIWVSKDNNNRVPDDEHIDEGKWNLSLSRAISILPIALIAMTRYYNPHVSKDTDKCNFNYECATPVWWFTAVNNMLSAFSIFVVSLICMTLKKRAHCARRFFPLNTCIMLTGIFWTSMNYCPQNHSFHLFTIAMIMMVLEAKFLLFGMQNTRKPIHHHYIGIYTFFLMSFIILDATFENAIIHKVSIAFIIITFVASAFSFSYFHGNNWFDNLRYWINFRLWRAPSLLCIPSEGDVPNRPAPTAIERPHVPEIQEDPALPAREAGYQIVDDLDEAFREVDSRRSGSQENLLAAEEREEVQIQTQEIPVTENILETAFNAIRMLPARQKMLKLYFVLAIVNIICWLLYGCFITPYFDISGITLRILQCDFVLYFVLFCTNRAIDIYLHGLHKTIKWKIFTFCLTTGVLIIGIIFWWFIETYRLTAYIRWSPAESRVLNQKCLFESLGVDWRDILHYLSAGICLLYVLVAFQIYRRLNNEKIRTIF